MIGEKGIGHRLFTVINKEFTAEAVQNTAQFQFAAIVRHLGLFVMINCPSCAGITSVKLK